MPESEKGKLKVLFIMNIPSPYRVRFFDLLSERCDLTVVYDRHTAVGRDSKWYVESNKKYNEVFLKGINYSDDAAITFGIHRYLTRNKFDVVVVGGYATFTQMISIVIMKLKHIPYYLSVDGILAHPESKMKQFVKKYFIQGAKCYLSTGKDTDNYLVAHGAVRDRIKRYPFTSLSKGDIREDIVSNDEKSMKKQMLGCETANMVVAVGSPFHEKGFDVLLKAIHLQKVETDLFIIGELQGEECRAIIESYRINHVHVLPFMKNDFLADYYAAADLFVMPTRHDVWGLVVNEALSFGLPVISSDKCNAGLELIENDVNGYVVQTENDKELANAIEKVLTRIDKNEFGRNSLKKIRDYTLENMAAEHMKIFVDEGNY